MNISWWSHSTRSLGNNVDRAGLLAGMRNRRQHVGRQKYDQSLLAIIGILNALKHESNIGG
ncbi:hypothetical protein L208DRAFT_1395851 [Tricholoma matsutake]|nr:hypothetical protein L208DRAFT_1395851 [Tricholoma matsutake 945]